MAKVIMIQGTSSDVGKSILTTGLCRIFSDDGYKVAPFKAQNMSRNAFVMKNGHVISKSIAIQSFAAREEPSTDMNPIVLIPEDNIGSQVILNGEVYSTMKAKDYYKAKETYKETVVRPAFERLSKEYDVIVLEGAGSPAEINLREHDLVNMGMALLAKSPVILAGDIDKGGVFASLAGTKLLLEQEEQALIKGVLINKFRGDIDLLTPGLARLEEIMGCPVLGVVPYLDIDIEKEDSLSLGSNDFQSQLYTDEHMEENIKKLAVGLRAALDMKEIYEILNRGV